MKVTVQGSEVDVLFDFAIVVYKGPDAGRAENRIKGRPYFRTEVPTIVLKEQATKLLRDDRYALWSPRKVVEAPKAVIPVVVEQPKTAAPENSKSGKGASLRRALGKI